MEQIIIPYSEEFSFENNPDVGGFILTIPKYLLVPKHEQEPKNQQVSKDKSLIIKFIYPVHISIGTIMDIVKKYGTVTVNRLSDNKFRVIYDDYRDAEDAFRDLRIKGEKYDLFVEYE
jgi:hypothetical protein